MSGLTPEYREWLRQNTQVAAEFHHQYYPQPRYLTYQNDDGRTYEMSEAEWERWRNFYCII